MIAVPKQEHAEKCGHSSNERQHISDCRFLFTSVESSTKGQGDLQCIVSGSFLMCRVLGI